MPRLRLCRTEAVLGRWLQRGKEVVSGDPVLGLMALPSHTAGKGKETSSTGEVGSESAS